MQAFREVIPYQLSHEVELPLSVYRVKEAFTINTVHWPVGAIRFWTDEDRKNYHKELTDLYGGDQVKANQFFNERFERIELRYPEA